VVANEIRDTGIILEGPVVSGLFRTFRMTWEAMGRKPVALKSRYRYNDTHQSNGLSAIPIFASSARGRRKFLKFYKQNSRFLAVV